MTLQFPRTQQQVGPPPYQHGEFGPTLATVNRTIFAVWRGTGTDSSNYWTTFENNQWVSPQKIPLANTTWKPSLAGRFSSVDGNDYVVAAWKSTGDESIWYSTLQLGSDSWQEPKVIPGIFSAFGPSLASDDDIETNHVYAVWRGSFNDQTLWWSRFDGDNWIPQQHIPGFLSSIGPSVVWWQGVLFAAWKGMDKDEKLWYSSWDGKNWAPQKVVQKGNSVFGTSVGPSLILIAFGDQELRPLAAWKGTDNDEKIWYSYYSPNGWTMQQYIPHVGSSVRPSMASITVENIILAWKGVVGDTRLWWTSALFSN